MWPAAPSRQRQRRAPRPQSAANGRCWNQLPPGRQPASSAVSQPLQHDMSHHLDGASAQQASFFSPFGATRSSESATLWTRSRVLEVALESYAPAPPGAFRGRTAASGWPVVNLVDPGAPWKSASGQALVAVPPRWRFDLGCSAQSAVEHFPPPPSAVDFAWCAAGASGAPLPTGPATAELRAATGPWLVQTALPLWHIVLSATASAALRTQAAALPPPKSYSNCGQHWPRWLSPAGL
mmetsp:Transcript_18935/g.41674  ORF Transcript_18935/g.41674 Transcript_18935/m.41674 type:complete len:238 (+) Transcript_18935:1713-2426(+)